MMQGRYRLLVSLDRVNRVRRAWWNVARRRRAMVVPRQGRRERSYLEGTGATEDAVLGASSAARRHSDVPPSPPLGEDGYCGRGNRPTRHAEQNRAVGEQDVLGLFAQVVPVDQQ